MRDERVKTAGKVMIYLKLESPCGARQWFFFEDDDKDHLKGTIGFAHQVEPKLGETDWDVIRQWVDGCLQRHQGCTGAFSIDLPGFEVIDCKTRKIVPGAKGDEFAALSYVWSSPHTHENRSILPNPFPEAVIEDALACTTKLNIPYLWVDRYCIDQNDTSGTKQRLIQSMDQIYSAAKVTIINVAGKDASAGLPGVSDTRRISSLSKMVIGYHKVIPVNHPKREIATSKWAQRGWTLQEGLLARRRLVFTDTHVYFQCTQSQYIEGLPREFDLSKKLKAGPDHTLDIESPTKTQAFPSSVIGSDLSSFSIKDVCNEFTFRDLKMDEDALKACLGIFSRLWASQKPEYQYCGLPFQARSENAFAFALLWNFDGNRYAFPENYKGASPFRRASGPSWSWISWRGHMGFHYHWRPVDSNKVRLCVDIKIPRRHKEQDIMSSISDYVNDIDNGGLYQHWLPYIRLSGWVATMRFQHMYDLPDNQFDGDVHCYHPSRGNELGFGTILPAMWAQVLQNDQAFSSSRLLDVIFFCYDDSISRLIIHHVGEERADTYERLGSCHMDRNNTEMIAFQDMSHVTEIEVAWLQRDLECRFETITLI